jgi:hypothetical protein
MSFTRRKLHTEKMAIGRSFSGKDAIANERLCLNVLNDLLASFQKFSLLLQASGKVLSADKLCFLEATAAVPFK